MINGVYELLKEGNYQANLLEDLEPFKKGEDVDLMLVDGGKVLVTDDTFVEGNVKEVTYNFKDKSDYDKYFKIY